MALSFRCAAVLASALLVASSLPAHAEKADRYAKINIEADNGGTFDLLNKFVIYRGNVVITKGTIVIRAARVEVRESPDGYHSAVAFGSPAQHATFRQERDQPNEWIEGDAERLEYDGKSDVVRFVNNATWRRLVGAETIDEITGNLITYDATTEQINVGGGAPSTAANPGGRVRAILTPREGSPAALEAEAAASAAASAAPAAPLKMTPALGTIRK